MTLKTSGHVFMPIRNIGFDESQSIKPTEEYLRDKISYEKAKPVFNIIYSALNRLNSEYKSIPNSKWVQPVYYKNEKRESICFYQIKETNDGIIPHGKAVRLTFDQGKLESISGLTYDNGEQHGFEVDYQPEDGYVRAIYLERDENDQITGEGLKSTKDYIKEECIPFNAEAFLKLVPEFKDLPRKIRETFNDYPLITNIKDADADCRFTDRVSACC